MNLPHSYMAILLPSTMLLLESSYLDLTWLYLTLLHFIIPLLDSAWFYFTMPLLHSSMAVIRTSLHYLCPCLVVYFTLTWSILTLLTPFDSTLVYTSWTSLQVIYDRLYIKYKKSQCFGLLCGVVTLFRRYEDVRITYSKSCIKEPETSQRKLSILHKSCGVATLVYVHACLSLL